MKQLIFFGVLLLVFFGIGCKREELFVLSILLLLFSLGRHYMLERRLSMHKLKIESHQQTIQEMMEQICWFEKECASLAEQEHLKLLKNGYLSESLCRLRKRFKEVDEQREEFNSKTVTYDFLSTDDSILSKEYESIIHVYRFYNAPLVAYLCSPNLRLTSYEVLLCVFSFNRISIQQTALLLGKTEIALKKAHQRIREKMKSEKDFHYLSDYLRSKF